MPELPEVEIVARRATTALAGREIASIMIPGIKALRSLDPPPDALVGSTVTAVRRRGKLLLIDTDGEHLLLIHLMTGGGMTWKPGKVNPRDRAMRVIVKFSGDGEPLRIRERGTRQAMWLRAIRREDLLAGGDAVPELAKLGPEAWWPDGDEARLPAESGTIVDDADVAEGVPTAATIAAPVDDAESLADQIAEALNTARPLSAALRDQKVLAGVGRTWSDEILWAARRSPYARGNSLSLEERREFVHTMRDVLAEALAHYEAKVPAEPPEKLTKPVKVHGKEGEPCPSCGTKLRAVHFESHTIAYCPKEQTDGKALKDRRLSRLGIEDVVDDED